MATTIAAIASPPGPGARGILRVSGPRAGELAERALAETPGTLATAPRGVWRGRFDDGGGTQPVTVFWMPGPRSYTREDVAEFHLPGSPPLLARALGRLFELGAAAAAPGEFTRRAFLNGRLDLSRVEGVLGLVEASNAAERRAAAQLLLGGLETRIQGLRDGLDDLRSLAEASLDFEESDTGHVETEELLERADLLGERIAEALRWELRRQPPSHLPRVLLVGPPNAGKSSLFNRLTEDGAALVSRLSGTTRDVLEGAWRLGRGACLLVDAPGVDPGATGPLAEGQRLARAEREKADLVLHVRDATEPWTSDPEDELVEHSTIVVWNKLDLVATAPPVFPGAVACSAITGEGCADLELLVADRLGLSEVSARGTGARAAAADGRFLFLRHRRALDACGRGLDQAREGLRSGHSLDLVAGALRQAGEALDEISGRTTPEDLLDRIFARFCLGK